jgi:hypothetical protein
MPRHLTNLNRPAPPEHPPSTPWTGETYLGLRNGRGWDAGMIDVAVGRDTLQLRRDGRSLCTIDRDHLAHWLDTAPDQRQPWSIDGVTWSVDNDGLTVITDHTGIWVTIEPEHLAHLHHAL